MFWINRDVHNGGVSRVDCRERTPLQAAEPLIYKFVLFAAAKMRDPSRKLLDNYEPSLMVGSDIENVIELQRVENAIGAAFGSTINRHGFSVRKMKTADAAAVRNNQQVSKNRIEGQSPGVRNIANDRRDLIGLAVHLHDVVAGHDEDPSVRSRHRRPWPGHVDAFLAFDPVVLRPEEADFVGVTIRDDEEIRGSRDANGVGLGALSLSSAT